MPNAINNDGNVVGQNADGRAFIYRSSDGSMNILGSLGGPLSEALDINDDGTAVGYTSLENAKLAAFMWTSETGMESMNPGSSFEYVAESINNNNEVAGWATNGTATRSVLWSDPQSPSFIFGSTNHKALGSKI